MTHRRQGCVLVNALLLKAVAKNFAQAFKLGEVVEYYSASQGSWIPAKAESMKKRHNKATQSWSSICPGRGCECKGDL